MWYYAVRRIMLAIPIAIGVTIVCFCLVYLAPGDPVTLPAGRAAGLARWRPDACGGMAAALAGGPGGQYLSCAGPIEGARVRKSNRQPAGTSMRLGGGWIACPHCWQEQNRGTMKSNCSRLRLSKWTRWRTPNRLAAC